MSYLRYRPEIEQPEPEEQETIDGIIRGMTQQSQAVEQRERVPPASRPGRRRP